MSCSKEKPTAPHNTPVEIMGAALDLSRPEPGEPTKFYIETTAQLKEILDEGTGVDLEDGDTLFLKGGETFDLGGDSYGIVNNYSLYFIGESPRPTIKSTFDDANPGKVLYYNNADHDKRFEFRNIRLESTSSSRIVFLWATGYGTMLIEDVVGDLSATRCFLSAVHDTIRTSEFSSTGRSLRLDAPFNGTDVVMDSVDVTLVSPAIDNEALYADFATFTNDSIIVTNCSFDGPTGKYFAKLLAGNRPGGSTLRITIRDSDLGPMKCLLDGSQSPSTVDYVVTYDGNNSDAFGPCEDAVEDLFVIGDSGIDVTYTFALPWSYAGNPITWEHLGDVESGTNYTVVKCEDTYYLLAAFALKDDDGNEYGDYFNAPVVKYDDADETTLSYYATVYWNSGLNRWNAEMDLTGVSSPIDWQCTMTVCDSTATGHRVEDVTYTLKGAGPCWIEDFMGGGGDPEEEEEEGEE